MKGTDSVGMPKKWQNTAGIPGDDSGDVQECKLRGFQYRLKIDDAIIVKKGNTFSTSKVSKLRRAPKCTSSFCKNIYLIFLRINYQSYQKLFANLFSEKQYKMSHGNNNII